MKTTKKKSCARKIEYHTIHLANNSKKPTVVTGIIINAFQIFLEFLSLFLKFMILDKLVNYFSTILCVLDF